MFLTYHFDWNLLNDPDVLTIIGTLIGSIITAIPGFLSWIAGRNVRETKQELRLEHLNKLYEPLDNLLNFKIRATPSLLMADVTDLITKQYRYASPELVQHVCSLRDAKPQDFTAFSELRLMVSATHHWYRRKLGYSYDKTVVKRKNVPKSVRRFSFNFDVISVFFLLISISFLFIAIGFAMYQFGIMLQSLSALLFSICLLVLIIKSVK